jgi:hypothetical protein
MTYVLQADELKLVKRELVTDNPLYGWIYKFIINANGETRISRVPADKPYWNHGVLLQNVDIHVMKFVPANVAGCQPIFKTLDEALKWASDYAIQEA